MPKEEAVKVMWATSFPMAVLLALGMGGPAYAGFITDVDSVADATDLTDKTFVLTSGMINVADDDLEFRQVAQWAKNALRLIEYTEAISKDKAALLVQLSYVKGDPKGFQTQEGIVYVADASLTLEAFSLKTPGKQPKVWKTTFSASNLNCSIYSPNSRLEFMHMLIAGLPCIGTNTGHSTAPLTFDEAGLARQNSISGPVVHGFVGIEMREVTEEDVATVKLSRRKGATVVVVFPDTPAAAAGLQAKDVVVALNDKTVPTAVELQRLIGECWPGTELAFKVAREGGEVVVRVVVGKLDDIKWDTTNLGSSGDLGADLRDLTDLDVVTLKLIGHDGVLVEKVIAGSPAEKAGLKPNDIIRGAKGKPVATRDALAQVIRETVPGTKLAFTVLRDGKDIPVEVTIGNRLLLKDE